MTKRQKRLVVAAVILGLVLALLAGYFYIYKRTKKLTFRVTGTATSVIPMPEFLFTFSGEGGDRLQRPVGVMVDDGTVYVTDSVRSRIYTFDEDGNLKGSFGASETANPLYLARNPKDGNIYVTDRRRYTILKYTPEGRYVGEFKPNLPAAQRPRFETGGVLWQPIALGFAADGTMYVTEILNGHRLLVFDPNGAFVNSSGDAGSVADPTKGPEVFQFPNAIMVVGNQVFVADSNNQRVKVYNKRGEYVRTIVTGGLPRGLAALQRFPGDDDKAPQRFVQTDTLSHFATIWTFEGKQALSFGEQGVLDGQFSYPGAVARGSRNRMFIADTSNGRIQAWGWPVQEAGLPPLKASTTVPICLGLPLLLLPLLLLRRKQFFATAEFVRVMIAREDLESLRHGRRRWVTTPAQHAIISALDYHDVDLASMFEVVEHSESDVTALMKKYDLDRETAITLNTAERSKVACIEEEDVRRLAKMLEMNVFNAEAFVERYRPKR